MFHSLIRQNDGGVQINFPFDALINFATHFYVERAMNFENFFVVLKESEVNQFLLLIWEQFRRRNFHYCVHKGVLSFNLNGIFPVRKLI